MPTAPISKPWYTSKTLFVNGATFIVALIGLLTQQPWISANPHIVAGLGMVVTAINFGMRFTTSTSLTS